MTRPFVIRPERPDHPRVVALYERCGDARRGPFGGYPDNGLSAFYAKSLTPSTRHDRAMNAA